MTFRWPVFYGILKDARLLWWSIGLIFLVPFLIARTPASGDNVILYSGMVLELVGIVVVAWGMTQLRQTFGRPPLRADVIGWFRRFGEVFGAPRGATLSAASVASATAFGEGRLVHSVGADATPEQRISALETNLANLRDELDSKVARLRQDIAAANERIERESRERQSGLQDISRKLEDFAVGDLHLEFVGLFWVALGMIETNIPAILAGWLQAWHLL